MSNSCPRCWSPDTVSYWAKKTATDNVIRSTIDAVYREHYPNARRCVDCEFVWDGESPPRFGLGMVKTTKPGYNATAFIDPAPSGAGRGTP